MLILEGTVVERREKGSRNASMEFFVTTERKCEKFCPKIQVMFLSSKNQNVQLLISELLYISMENINPNY